MSIATFITGAVDGGFRGFDWAEARKERQRQADREKQRDGWALEDRGIAAEDRQMRIEDRRRDNIYQNEVRGRQREQWNRQVGEWEDQDEVRAVYRNAESGYEDWLEGRTTQDTTPDIAPNEAGSTPAPRDPVVASTRGETTGRGVRPRSDVPPAAIDIPPSQPTPAGQDIDRNPRRPEQGTPFLPGTASRAVPQERDEAPNIGRGVRRPPPEYGPGDVVPTGGVVLPDGAPAPKFVPAIDGMGMVPVGDPRARDNTIPPEVESLPPQRPRVEFTPEMVDTSKDPVLGPYMDASVVGAPKGETPVERLRPPPQAPRPTAGPDAAPKVDGPVEKGRGLRPDTRMAVAVEGEEAVARMTAPAETEAALQAAGQPKDGTLTGFSQAQKDRGAGSYMQYFREEVAPDVVRTYLSQGKVAEADAFMEWIDGTEARDGMKAWSGAVFAATIGDSDGFVDGLAEAYNSRGYFPDGYGIDKRKSGLTRDDDGNITGAKVTFIDEDSGDRFEQTFDGVADLVQQGIGMLSPQAAFEQRLAQSEGARSLQVDAYEDARKLRLEEKKLQLKAQYDTDDDTADEVLDAALKLVESSSLSAEPLSLDQAIEQIVTGQEQARARLAAGPQGGDSGAQPDIAVPVARRP